MKKRHGSANVLLIELVLVILFFMLCTSTIVEMFGLARLKSGYAKTESQAMLVVENLESRLAGSADAESELQAEGFEQEDGIWVLRGEGYMMTAAESAEKTEAGTLRTVLFSAKQNNGNELFEVPVVHYLSGEVSP